MIEITDITFHVIDVEFEDEYDFTGHFFNEEEVSHFIEDNEKVGNDVRILEVKILTPSEVRDLILSSPYIEETVRAM